MRWRILVENNVRDAFEDAGLPVYDDQFAPDGSDWGPGESGTVEARLNELQAADPDHRSYAATLAPDSEPLVEPDPNPPMEPGQ